MRWTFAILGLTILCSAYPEKKRAYEPWYTGSLIASSGKTVAPDVLTIQPYVIVNNRYGLYDLNFKFHSRPNTVNVNPLVLIQSGINKYMDFQINAGTSTKFHQSNSKTNFTDISVLIGVQIYRNDDTETYIRFAINQFFPTGSYQRLNPNRLGIDISGSGTFQSNIAIYAQRTFYWLYNHPIRIRWNFSIALHSKTRVHGYNAYGGGFGANELLRPGTGFNIVIAPEFSITQRWVATFDLVYQHKVKGTMSGFPGVDHTGRLARINIQRIDLLTWAPAIEYNFSPDFGIIAGVQASLLGRNTVAFIGGSVSLVATF